MKEKGRERNEQGDVECKRVKETQKEQKNLKQKMVREE
jgi:hypothetical protein